MKARTLWALAGACAILAACGGGGDDGVAATNNAGSGGVPQSAQASVSGLIAYLQDLIGNGTSETGQPVSLEGAELPVSDTTEPAGI